jgi:hypothetical protein
VAHKAKKELERIEPGDVGTLPEGLVSLAHDGAFQVQEPSPATPPAPQPAPCEWKINFVRCMWLPPTITVDGCRTAEEARAALHRRIDEAMSKIEKMTDALPWRPIVNLSKERASIPAA